MSRTLREEIMEGLPLNEKEFDVLAYAAQGLTSAETGKKMFLAEETVTEYRKVIIAKLAARNTAHAVALGIGMGYVNVEDVLEEHESGGTNELG
jgi:DNA-binding CsgD family transcriptional regulator